MKGYKAFNKGLVCRDKQYAENTVFEESKASICETGMHFCENPLDVLDYYPLLDDNCELTEFAEVEALADTQTDDKRKFVTTKLKIGAKIDFPGFVKASVNFMLEHTKSKHSASGDGSKLAASGYGSKLAASGDWSKLAASGDLSKLAASGDLSKLAASGDLSQLAASGDLSKLAASGDLSQLAASGYGSKLAASGYGSQLAISGKNSVGANIGISGKIKGVVGSWIILAEYDNQGICLSVQSAKIDGEILKANTWYTLKDGKFTEVK
jgi:hypothetical protein